MYNDFSLISISFLFIIPYSSSYSIFLYPAFFTFFTAFVFFVLYLFFSSSVAFVIFSSSNFSVSYLLFFSCGSLHYLQLFNLVF